MAELLSTSIFPLNWSDQGGEEVKLTELFSSSAQFQNVKKLLSGESLENLIRIVRVQNPYLYGRYLLRKQEYKMKYGTAKERILLHATGAHKVGSIVADNLDWRLACRYSYGRGVCFSPCATYANEECNRANGDNRAILYCKVLVNRSTYGYSTNKLPPTNFDTTTDIRQIPRHRHGHRHNVYVKYYDDEFYPEYVAYYTNTFEPSPKCEYWMEQRRNRSWL